MTTFSPGAASSVATSIGDRLKVETADLHTRAEKSPLQAALVQGRLSREAYAGFLGQMLLVHEALERAVSGAACSHPAVAAIWSDEQRKAPLVREDLVFYGVDPSSVAPLAETRAVIDLIGSRTTADPVASIGMHYVLEGANNGNQFIARVIRKVYALDGADGTKSLDPYGTRQREAWASWKASLNAQAFTAVEQDRIVEGAAAMFQAIIDVSDAVWRSVGKEV
ncbi:MAG: biliverdin-producing heme oxygenase [Phycisphaeraceae bacterium]|nr:biliverdin-producing heme oxygenase [Phycisphaeraceae bacterium]